ncbi:MAG TPA: DNA topoisomerase (ATP-hydrolyzing) subunit B [Candidatus Nanoarchaeia archaeon]|nr:DNA topoisomerase (ATP-hydrolyzing) subunit B [Candidatus Nanoarchaeia archaeon]
MASEKSYTAESIKVLEGLDAVRKRPGMYIGSTGKDGLHHMIQEVVDNSVDEALAGYCKHIIVSLNEDNSVTVEDDGRGIPVDIHPQYKIPAAELALTKLHAGGKFDKKTYLISGGLHGVGVSVVNALSKKLILEIKRNGAVYLQEYARGVPQTKLKEIKKIEKKETGTKVTFFPDEEIFSTIKFDTNTLETRLREIAFLNAGLKITLIDKVRNKKQDFFYSGGLIEFIKWINESKEVVHKPIYFKREEGDILLEVSIQYNDGYRESIFGFVNTINTVEGGTHIFGFRTALTRVINDYAKKSGVLKNGKDEALTGDDVREGLTAIINLKIPEPQFEGQTKTKLGNSEIRGLVDSITTSSLSTFFEENPPIAKKIISKALDAARARIAAKKAKELVRKKSAFSLGGLPGKLADCSKKSTIDTEIYLVEGESAGGSAKQARNKENQAILPLKGKILNVEKSNPAKTLSSEEIVNLITALGTGVGENFDLEKLRYDKVIIMTDADVDGEHIKTLLLTFFFRFMPKLIENGNIYIALPPLYRIRKKKDHYVYSDEELKKELSDSGQGNVTRFKGLGEMDSTQLWETTMNPKTRKIKKIFIEDAVEADKTFSMLMGSDVPARKVFISENAKEANLDI